MRTFRWMSRLVGIALVAFAAAFVHPASLLALPMVFGATTTIDDLDEALKIFFTDPIVNNVVTDTELLSQFMEDNNVQVETTTGGRFIETAQYFALPAGVGARAPGDYIPVPEGPIIKNSRVFLKKIQGVVEMQGDVMARVKGDMGAYLNWMDRALPDLVTFLNNEVDRMLLGFGSAALARINEADPTTDDWIVIDSAYGVDGLEDAFLLFLEGMRVVFSANPDGDPLRNAGTAQSAKIIDIDVPGSRIRVTMDAALQAALVNNDYIFPGDGAGASVLTATGEDREIQGLLGMVDNGDVLATFQNLVRADFRLWRSHVFDASQAPYNGTLSEELLTFADDQTAVLGGGKVNMIVSSRSGVRSYWKSLKGDKALNDPRTFTGGKDGVEIILGDRTVRLKSARKMPPQLTFGLQTDTFKRWQLEGYMWDDKTGSIWNRVTDGTGRKDAFYAVGNWYIQTGNLAPAKNFRIEGLVRA